MDQVAQQISKKEEEIDFRLKKQDFLTNNLELLEDHVLQKKYENQHEFNEDLNDMLVNVVESKIQMAEAIVRGKEIEEEERIQRLQEIKESKVEKRKVKKKAAGYTAPIKPQQGQQEGDEEDVNDQDQEY